VNIKKRLLVLISLPSVWLLMFFIIPFSMMALFSFRDNSFGPLFPPTLKHYQAFFASKNYLRMLADSSWIAFLTALISILLAYPLAYFLIFRGGKHRLMLLSLLIIPAWTSYLLRILAWKVMLGSGGIINSILIQLGWISERIPLILYSRSAVIITLVYIWIPYAALPIFSSLERIEPHLLDASSDLGANPWRTFFNVTLPLSIPGIAAAFFFVFIPTLGEWVTPALVGGVDGIMYGNLIQNQFLRGLNWPLGIVMSLVLMVIVSVFTVLLYRFISIRDMSSIA
jgi:spermidine/putrescine transport system permease protein